MNQAALRAFIVTVLMNSTSTNINTRCVLHTEMARLHYYIKDAAKNEAFVTIKESLLSAYRLYSHSGSLI